jgi:hypothetical protein
MFVAGKSFQPILIRAGAYFRVENLKVCFSLAGSGIAPQTLD